MKNRDLIEFAKYFSAGAQKGVEYYTKGRQQQAANAIATERNRILAQDKAARDQRENRRLDIYGRSVDNQGVLAQARAKAALAKIGAKGGPVGLSEQGQKLIDKYNAEGGNVVAPPATASGGTTVINQTSDSGVGEDQPLSPPASEPEPSGGDGGGGGDGYRRGGAVRKFADGGISGEMSLGEAEQGGPGGRSGGGGLTKVSNMFGSSFKLAPGSLNPNLKTPATPTVRPVGPAGSGPGGSYTTADTQQGGALDLGGGLSGVTYRRGGAVQRYANGGAVIDTGTSGPGSGFGVPAAPPVGARRA